MPRVLCGIDCFHAVSQTVAAIVREFSASLDPALGKANCDIEVYRLERVPADVRVAAEEAVLCRVPGWHFDFAAIEDLHRQFEDLRIEHERLKVGANSATRKVAGPSCADRWW